MQRLFKCLEDCVHMSALADFKNYVNQFSEVTKWFMCSDYCIDDSTKPNDVITFVLYPYVFDFPDWKAIMNGLRQTDFKDCKHISGDFAKFCHSGLIFSVSFILEKNNILKLFFNNRTAMQNLSDTYIDMMNTWKTTTPSNAEHYADMQKRLRQLKESMRQKNFQFKLLGRIVMTVFLASYLRFMLIRELDTLEIFSWLSDRDNITSFHNSIYEVLYEIGAWCMCEKNITDGKHSRVRELMLKNLEQNIFYDEMNRSADLICGGLASYDCAAGAVTKDKHVELLEDVIADNPYIIVLDVQEKFIGRAVISRLPKE